MTLTLAADLAETLRADAARLHLAPETLAVTGNTVLLRVQAVRHGRSEFATKEV